MGKKSGPAAPPPPDYTGAAEKTAASQQEAQTRADWANRPNQITPWGTSSWTSSSAIDPATGKPVTNWTQQVKLTDAQQRALDDQMAIEEGKSGLAFDMLGRAGAATGQPFDPSVLTQIAKLDPSKLGDYGNLNYDSLPQLIAGLDESKLGAMPDSGFGAVEDVQKAMMARMSPDLLRRREGEIQRLKSMGVTEGSEAWDNAIQNLSRGENDASQQALLGATKAYGDVFLRGLQARQQGVSEQAQNAALASGARGQYSGERENVANFLNALRGQKFGEQVTASNLTGQQRQQDIAEQAYLRSLPLNELNALLTGAQVGMPSMPGFSSSQAAGAVDYLGATNMADKRNVDLYNAQQAAGANKSSGFMGMLGTIGGGMMGGPIGGMVGKSLLSGLG